VFSFKLAQEFKQRAQAAIPFPRGAVMAAAPNLPGAHPRLGAYVSLGAIALGGALMIANIAHERRTIAVAVAPPAKIKAAPEIKAVALEPPKIVAAKPDPIAVAMTPAPEKMTARIDTMPVAAIRETPQIKPTRRHRRKKFRRLDKHP
jgi:hypothetical protein